jgi:ClpP class serine protease
MNQPVHITIDQPPAIAAALEAPEKRRRASAFDLVAATPWAIQPDMLATISAIARREGEGVEAVEARTGRPLQNARKVSLRGNVAVVPVTGPIFRYANLMTEISGATSLDVLAKDFTAALDDPNVGAIVLDINSPGGQAAGIADFAAMVRAAGKPVAAFVDGMAASAAYWIAAAASQVVISKNGIAGNVGAVLGYDLRKDPQRGEIVSSQSPNKRPDLSTDQGKAQMQVLVDAQAQVFIDDVAAYRGMTAEAVIADFGGGDMFTGAKAVAIGMADRIGTLEETIAGLAGKQQIKPATNLNLKGTAMNLDELRAAHPDLCATLMEEGRIVGATAERQRILDVESQALPGHEALIAQLKADGTTTGPMAAVAILKAEREVAAGRIDKLTADAPKPVAHAAAPDDKPQAADDSLPLEQRAQAKWDSDPATRAEFGEFKTFLAYAKAHDAGTVKILSK